MVRVVVGGTFDFFHKGHRALLRRAIEVGNEIMIGITSDEMAERSRGYEVRPYEKRKADVEEYMEGQDARFSIVEITDPCGRNEEFGSAAEEPYDIIVVSPETKAMARKINEARKSRGLEPMRVVMIPCIMADDNKPLSSHRIRKGDIDDEGHIKD